MQLGSGLLVSMEKPEDFLPQLVQPGTNTTVVFAGETCSEEKKVENDLEAAMENSRLVDVWGNTILHVDDIPNRIWDKFPQSSTNFMRGTDSVAIRQTMPTPQSG